LNARYMIEATIANIYAIVATPKKIELFIKTLRYSE
jgi:hypothetical protein